MGGHGSGRLNKTDAFLKKNSEVFKTVSPNVASVGGEVLVIPNHSGISTHPEMLGDKGFVKKTGDTMTGALTLQFTDPTLHFRAAQVTTSVAGLK